VMCDRCLLGKGTLFWPGGRLNWPSWILAASLNYGADIDRARARSAFALGATARQTSLVSKTRWLAETKLAEGPFDARSSSLRLADRLLRHSP
jgi:hypothetical protein